MLGSATPTPCRTSRGEATDQMLLLFLGVSLSFPTLKAGRRPQAGPAVPLDAWGDGGGGVLHPQGLGPARGADGPCLAAPDPRLPAPRVRPTW